MCTVFLHEVRWFDGKVVDIHAWGLRITPHEQHSYGQQWYVDKIYILNS
jgi:hypothetical protein